MRALCLSWIDRYRHSAFAERTAGCCRFSPTCSHYAEDVLRTRAVPVALVLIAVRILRCRRPMRATTRRKVAAVLLLSGIVTLGTASLAQAASTALMPPTVTRGGCELALGGRDIGQFHRNNPLYVTKGKRISADGLAPAHVRNRPEPAGSYTDIGVDLQVALSYSFKGETHKGLRTFNTTINVDKYLDLGSGLYRVTIKAAGKTPNTVVWTCQATLYVRLDGSPVPGLVAGALGLAGLGAAASASGKSDWQVGDEVPEEAGNSERDVANKGSTEIVKLTVEPDASGNRKADLGSLGCVLAIFAGVFGYEPGDAAAAVAAGLGVPAPEGRRFYRRGHMVRGFFGGLLMGLGATVFMQQRGYWLLTWMTVFVLPLGLALVFGWRGWRGKAFRVVSTNTPAAAPPPAATTEPAPTTPAAAPPAPPVPSAPPVPPTPAAPAAPVTPVQPAPPAQPYPPAAPPAPPAPPPQQAPPPDM